jgi:hypothetical protein
MADGWWLMAHGSGLMVPIDPGHQPSADSDGRDMRFIHLYLIGYFVLIVGAVLALWQAGVLARISGSWLAIGMVIVFGLGIMLAVTAAKPTVMRE